MILILSCGYAWDKWNIIHNTEINKARVDTSAIMTFFTWYGLWNKLGLRALPKRLSGILLRWMKTQRWFLEKQSSVANLCVHEVFRIEVEGKLVWWFLFQSPSSAERYYQLPVVLLPAGDEIQGPPIARWQGAETGFLFDAWSWPAFTRWFFSQIADENLLTPFLHVWRITPLQNIQQVKAFPIEQSNSSIQLDDLYFMKVFRIVQPGIQPEEEIGKELTARHFSNSIPLLAGISLATSKGSASLATVSPLISNRGNGWNWLLKTFRDYSLATAPHSDTISQHCQQSMSLLGQRTAELHQCLGLPAENPSFSTEVLTSDRITLRIQQLERALRKTVRLLSRFRPKDSLTRTLVSEFKQLVGEARNQCMKMPGHFQLSIQRIHGDYHLGQVLLTPDSDWLIIDFEGEPLRTLAERRSKDLPWRDVAGMLRSIDYAFHYAAMQYDISYDVVLASQLCRAFLDGYQQGLDANQKAAMNSWLPLLLLEKALYEIHYEMLSRPDWIRIPLAGANQLLRELV